MLHLTGPCDLVTYHSEIYTDTHTYTLIVQDSKSNYMITEMIFLKENLKNKMMQFSENIFFVGM